MQGKIDFLQDKIKDLSKEDLESITDILKNKDIEEYKQELEFNKELHRLNIDNIINWNNKLLSENNLNKILPSIRIQYIRSWKQYISSKELDKAKEIEKIISKFDAILDIKQKRDQKKEVFTKLFFFFFVETVALFAIIILNWFWYNWFKIDDTTLQIISWVTITQVAAMLMFIVQNLYPKKWEDEKWNDEKWNDNN